MNVANISSWYMKHVERMLSQLLVKEHNISHVDVHEPARKSVYRSDLIQKLTNIPVDMVDCSSYGGFIAQIN